MASRSCTPSNHRSAISGFTLVELLVVIAIIAILAAILFPVFARAREMSRQASCLSNMKQIGMGMEMWAQDNDWYWVGGGDWPYKIQGYIARSGSDGGAKVFQCPSDITPSGFTFGGNTYWISYGINCMICGQTGTNKHRDNCKNYADKVILTGASDDEIKYRSSSTPLIQATEGYRENAPYDNDPSDSGRIEKRHNNGENYLFGDWHAQYWQDPPGGNTGSATTEKTKYWWPDVGSPYGS